jgi:hypothetical protein
MPRLRRAPMGDEQRRQLLTRQADLTALTQHPSWPTLIAVVGEKRERMERIALQKTLGLGDPNRDELMTMRGFLAGMQYLLAICAGAERRLEEALAEHGVREEAS